MAQYIDQFGNLRFTQENESNGILDLYNKNQIDFNEQINMEPRDIAPPMNMDEMMYGSVLPDNQFNPTNFQSIFPASGNMQQAPLMNRFQGVSDMSLIDETTNDEQDQNYIDPVNKKSSLKDSLSNMGKKFGLSSLLGLITGNPILGLIGRGAEGLGALNDKMQNSDFGQSRTGAEYFMKRRERKQGERARTANADVYASADRQGFTNDRGGFSTNRADRAGTSVGSGQFNSKTSRGRTGY
jgi:hypothetical protein